MPSILVIDDNAPMRDSIRGFLTHASKYTIYEAATGAEGIAQARATRPTAILLDLQLPDMSGVDVIDALKKDSQTCGIPILVFTAHHEDGQLVEFKERGADGYLVKGGPLEQVLGYLEVLIKSSTPNGGEKIVVGPVTIDPKLHQVFVSNRATAPLTPREFDMLTYIAAKSPSVIPWETLAKAVWHEPKKYGKNSKTIELHAQRIRKKLGPNASGFIITHKSVGVQFITSIPQTLLSGRRNPAIRPQ